MTQIFKTLYAYVLSKIIGKNALEKLLSMIYKSPQSITQRPDYFGLIRDWHPVLSK